MYTYIYIYIYICTYIFIYIYIGINIYKYINLYMFMLLLQVRHHSGGVHAIAVSRRLGTPTGFAVSGGADFKIVMHDPITLGLKKTFSG